MIIGVKTIDTSIKMIITNFSLLYISFAMLSKTILVKLLFLKPNWSEDYVA